jgi:hypothetical protein
MMIPFRQLHRNITRIAFDHPQREKNWEAYSTETTSLKNYLSYIRDLMPIRRAAKGDLFCEFVISSDSK